jgi:cytochrome c peroxidase
MDRKTMAVLAAAAVMSFAVPAVAGKSSVELGKKLFNDPALGGSTNSTSCNTCHPDGKKLARAGKRKDLTAMINRCIVGPLKGERIDGRTVAMRSLKLYIKSLSE